MLVKGGHSFPWHLLIDLADIQKLPEVAVDQMLEALIELTLGNMTVNPLTNFFRGKIGIWALIQYKDVILPV